MDCTRHLACGHTLTGLLLWMCAVGVHWSSALEVLEPCPRLCHCDRSQEFSIHCIGQQNTQLSKVPSPLPRHVTNLEMNFNVIGGLSRESFPVKIPTLKRLVFSHCELHTLATRTFVNLCHLEELQLDNNRLRLVPPDAFYGLSELRFLSLNNNDLIRIDGWTFSGLSLGHLNLHDNPDLFAISQEAFANASVETLSLDRCSVTQVPQGVFYPLRNSLRVLHWSHSPGLDLHFSCLSGLRLQSLFFMYNSFSNVHFLRSDDLQVNHVFLNGNQVRSVDLSLYNSLQHTETLVLSGNGLSSISSSDSTSRMLVLKELDLSYNNLKDISSSLLDTVPNLTTLDLSHNALSVLRASLRRAFRKLSFLDISGNPISCNCSMEWYRQWLHTLDPAKVVVQGEVCRVTSFFNNSQQCEGPHIVALSDTSNHETFSFECSAIGLPIPTVSWRFITSQNGVYHHQIGSVSTYINSSANSNTSELIIEKSAVKLHGCLVVECYANNSMGVMHRKLNHCPKVDTSSFVGDASTVNSGRSASLAPVVAMAVVLSLTFASVTVLSKCARGLYVRCKERHEHQERLSHPSQRSLIGQEEDATASFLDDTDL